MQAPPLPFLNVHATETFGPGSQTASPSPMATGRWTEKHGRFYHHRHDHHHHHHIEYTDMLAKYLVFNILTCHDCKKTTVPK